MRWFDSEYKAGPPIRVLCVRKYQHPIPMRYMLYEDSIDQQHLIRFMRNMLQTSTQKVFLILDNLRVHHGKMVAEWVSRHQNKIELFFLPPYSPESNPDEYLNHALKLSVHSGNLPEDRSDIRHKANSFMRTLQRNKDTFRLFSVIP